MNKVVPRIVVFLPISLITALAIRAHVGLPFVVLLAVSWLSNLWIVFFAPRKPLDREPSLETTVIPEAGETSLWFAAMEYYILMWNRTYKVFVTDQGLFGAKVRGVVANPPLATSEMSNQAYWVNTKSSQIYSQMQLTSDAFLKENSANFRLLWTGVSSINYLPGRK